MLPAYAGMIPNLRRGAEEALGAPRVCGDDPSIAWARQISPYVLPAYAGMIRALDDGTLHGDRAPRVCGDDPRQRRLNERAARCSPRMRG